MKNYQIFLAYYTLLCSMLLFAWSFYGPKPQSYLLALLVTPMGIYFWLVMARNSKEFNETLESSKVHALIPLIILATLFVSSLSILAYSYATGYTFNGQTETINKISSKLDTVKQQLSNNNPNKDLKAQIDKMSADIAALRKETGISNSIQNLTQTKPSSNTVLGEDSSAGFVSISDSKLSSINVYEQKSLSSKIIGKMLKGQSYTFVEKDSAWYSIMLSDSASSSANIKQGYVEKKFVKEVMY